jgi:stage II sporulation protein D
VTHFASLGRSLGDRRGFGVLSMRRPLALLLVLVVLAATATAATGQSARRSAPLAVNATFVVTGHGWGHGVGMSQYGAYGYAQHGFTYAKILAHYYSGTTLGPAPVAKVRVLLTTGASTIKLGSTADFTATDAIGDTHDVTAGTYALTPKLKLKVDGDQQAKALTGPLTFQPGTSPLALGSRHYRGLLQVDLERGKLRVINVVGLEQYLYGVVPSEMPHTWAPEALKAQAVAARSYAIASKRTGAFDLYPDTRDQVYLGIDHEQPETNAAVDATARQVVLYNGQVAKTYFFSSSGGRTASSQDVWGKAIPYLVSVPDPYDSISPYHNWGPFAFSAAKLARVLHVPKPIVDMQMTLNSSGRVLTMTVLTPLGPHLFDGNALRQSLGLRSTWFTIGVLSLSGPSTPLTYGSSTALTGVARGVTPVVLQARSGGVWQAAGAVSPSDDGTLAVSVHPTTTTAYRLASGKVAAGSVRVRVAPMVRIMPPRTQTELRGYMRPVMAGAPVWIQRQNGTKWSNVARATVDASGYFDAQLQLVDGTYRARVAPGHGLVPGISQVLQVSSS